jgi:periplasmic copper chaperone A
MAAAALAAGANADTKVLGDLSLNHLIVRSASQADMDVAAYFAIKNDGAMDRFLGGFCTCAASVEVHQIVRDPAATTADLPVRTLMTMPVNVLTAMVLPSRSSIEFRPGSDLHLMFNGMKSPLAPGQKVDVTLLFEHAGAVTVPFVAVEDTRASWMKM